MRYNHALFLNPYIESSATSTMMLFPPTGLEYVATSAKDWVNKVTLLDLRYEKDLLDDRLIDFIKKEIDIVCVGIGWDRQFKEICTLLNRMPDTTFLVVGGYTATEKVKELFEKCPTINIVVRGEGENTIKDILKDRPLEDILGISYRRNGDVIHNQHSPLAEINSISYPDRTLRRNKYCLMLNGIKVINLAFDTVLSARGCPYNCKFCTFKLNPLGQKRDYSARSVESVVREIEDIPAKGILFSDENFSVDPKRAEAICDLIIARRIKKRFIAQTRIEIANHPVLLKKMIAAGFKVLLVGIESPHDRILAQLNKGFDSAAIRKYFKVLRKYPIYYHGYFIYGNIGETEEEMLYIAQFAKEIGVDSITFLKLRIEKFSPLKEIVEKTPGYYIGSNGVVFSDAYSYADLKKIARRIKFSFYTPFRIFKIFWKCFFVARFFTFTETMSFLFFLPLVLKGILVREVAKGRLFNTLQRVFINNAK
ncbi:MAG: radical SAM protein [Candidatus Omnitrophica bacterium]|nr:radical SAM protein [Candidatus Omnitrophota bacterium]